MYIVRWLLTHPLVLAWALAILAILLNFGMGSKHGDEKDSHHTVDAAKEGYDAAHGHAQHPATPTAQPTTTPEAVVAPAVTPTAAPTPQAVAPAAPEHAPAPVVPATPAIPAAPVVPATPAAPTTPAPEVAPTETPAPAAEETAPTTPAVPVVEEKAPAPATMPEAAAPAPTTVAEDPHTVVAEAPAPTAVSSENLLLMARSAYQKGDMTHSIQYYQQLIKQTPDNIAYKGELGNVYWRSGQPKEAAALYVDIAPQMIQAGQRQEVMNMLGFISLYFPDKVANIQSLLQQ